MSRTQSQDRAATRRTIEERIGALAARQHGVVTRVQLLGLGVRTGAIRRRVDSGRLRRLHNGVYLAGPLLPPLAREMAAVLACGDLAVLSHASAAALHELIPARPEDAVVEVTATRDRVRPGIRVHRVSRIAARETMEHHGIRVTTPLRTLIDIAGTIDATDLERAVARAEREGLVTARQLAAVVTRYRGRRGTGRLRSILALAGGPGFTRSEAESRFLALVRRARLPLPETNARVAEFEIDFLWREHGLGVEVDGYRFHASRPRFEIDRRRIARLASLGIQIIPVTWRQIVEDDVATAVLLGQALLHERGG